MRNLLNNIWDWIKSFTADCARAETVEGEEDYRRVKKWVRKAIALYVLCSFLAIPQIILVTGLLRVENGSSIAGIYSALCFLLAYWGLATMALHCRRIFRGIASTGRLGYEIGKTVQSTHVQVTHEYGDTYKVHTRTENKGCLFAIIGGMIRFLGWAMFCVYIGSFATFKKIHGCKRNLKAFEESK